MRRSASSSNSVLSNSGIVSDSMQVAGLLKESARLQQIVTSLQDNYPQLYEEITSRIDARSPFLGVTPSKASSSVAGCQASDGGPRMSLVASEEESSPNEAHKDRTSSARPAMDRANIQGQKRTRDIFEHETSTLSPGSRSNSTDSWDVRSTNSDNPLAAQLLARKETVRSASPEIIFLDCRPVIGTSPLTNAQAAALRRQQQQDIPAHHTRGLREVTRGSQATKTAAEGKARTTPSSMLSNVSAAPQASTLNSPSSSVSQLASSKTSRPDSSVSHVDPAQANLSPVKNNTRQKPAAAPTPAKAIDQTASKAQASGYPAKKICRKLLPKYLHIAPTG